jgi:RimJ/RimL family protein N-acetyltransferase
VFCGLGGASLWLVFNPNPTLTSLISMHIVSTSRLNLRQMTTADAEIMLALVNEPSWLRFIGDRGVHSLQQARDYIANGAMANYARLGFGFYMVELSESGQAIGMCGLTQRDYLDCPDIGFAFFPEFNGKGYAFEAAAAVLEYAKQTLGLPRILATTRLDNQRSAQLLEKLGMRLEKVILPPDSDKELSLYSIDF